ncbi:MULTISPECIES: serine hydrolase [Micromonospora]|uniref:serine hydrolase domain-containing protein n=1 Tax=Micromonospora TaxID=1873 RepID=UPI0005BA6377|nr:MULTISPECIES: serine hydrolase domain-containing protein [unclassified Micromonospora]MCK1807114.1 beta-lactamase family protein [Micromonospora sp. R42106]MCK1832220.1 beta-lactamase family protein [Micromonospora sp. R42003]MCK1843541.1 beta-lactamase family protein [Micromonospora sp. R42004]MCM1017971.1 beta-lactamase family protein [Micromonospora sp. XM-20-01]
MSVTVSTDPGRVGLDPARLARIDEHFARYVDDGRLAGWQIVVTRRGEIAHSSTYGLRDREAGTPVEADTLWRIYSMTKPITSVAAMMLWEEGRLELNDPVSRWLPEFADVRVYDRGSVLKPYTVPAVEPIRIWHLLTHTAGLTYGFAQVSVVDGLYRAAGFDLGVPPGADLAAASAGLARLPLLFQPGTSWNYGVSTDVLGRLVEVISGQSLDAFFAERILAPLGMTDTRWWVDAADAKRLAALYAPHPATGQAVRADAVGRAALAEPTWHSGGGGLLSTAADYHRFTQFLLRGGELDGVRLLGPRTVRFMTRNHLPGNRDLASFSPEGFAETILDGVGFGLGFAVVLDPVPSRVPSSVGEFYWGGLASTAFWVDPVEEVTALLFTQLMPSSTYPLRSQLRQLVYSAIVD